MEKLLNDSSPDDSLLGPAAVPLGTEGSAGIRLDENEKIMLENMLVSASKAHPSHYDITASGGLPGRRYCLRELDKQIWEMFENVGACCFYFVFIVKK